MGYSLSPSVDVREFDLSLTIPNLPSAKTGMVLRADIGPSLEIVNITNESDLIRYFGKPNQKNFKDWFNAWNFLQYASSLYVVRPMNAEAYNADILFNGASATEKASSADMYNSAVAEATLGSMAVADGKIKFINKYITSEQRYAVAICSSSANWGKSISDEGTVHKGVVSTAVSGQASIVFTGNHNFVLGDKITDADGTVFTITVVPDATHVTLGANITATSNFTGTIYASNSITSGKYASSLESSTIGAVSGIAKFSNFFEFEPDWTEGEFAIIVLYKNDAGKWELFEDEKFIVSKKETGRNVDGRNIFVEEIMFNKSRAFYAKVGGTIVTGPETAAMSVDGFSLATVDDTVVNGGTVYPQDGTYAYTGIYTVGDIQSAEMLFADSNIFDINILMAHETNINGASTIAESRRDCIAIVGPYDTSRIVGKAPSDATANLIADFGAKTAIPNVFSVFGSYSAMYANMKYQYDKFNDVNRWLPVVGDIAGLMAQTDANRDPWWAVAGLERGKMKNTIKLAFNATKQNLDDLYVNNLNPVITIAGEGTAIVYGQKTATPKPSAFSRINVRRLIITLQKAIATAARYALFEFNDEFTRARIRGMIEPFLRDVKGRRGVYDFMVVVDASNNTAEVVDNNALIIDIYIKPTKVAEFIRLNMKVTRTDANFAEFVGV